MSTQASVALRSFDLRVEGIPPSPNESLHFWARRRIYTRFRDDTSWLVRAAWPFPPMVKARATFTIVKRGKTFDQDNATALLKCLIDSLKIGGAIVDDDRAHLVELVVRQERGGVKERAVRILVEELEAI